MPYVVSPRAASGSEILDEGHSAGVQEDLELVVGSWLLALGMTALTSQCSNKVVWVTGILALVLAFSTVYFVHYFGETRPTVAQPDAGRTHAVKIHERIVYLTTGEYALAFTTHVIAIAGIGVFLGLLLRSFRKGPIIKSERR